MSSQAINSAQTAHEALDREKRRDQGNIILSDGKANVVGGLLATVSGVVGLVLAVITATRSVHMTWWLVIAVGGAVICLVSTLLHVVAVMMPRPKGLVIDKSVEQYRRRIESKAAAGEPTLADYQEGHRLQHISSRKFALNRRALYSLVGYVFFLIVVLWLML